MTTKPLSVDLPRIDGDTQSRVAITIEVVVDYAELIANADGVWPFPAVDVFYDGTDYWVGDGFHRVLAAQRSKRDSFPCRIHKGTAKDARIFGMTANDKHGLRMSQADKRACVGWLLDNGGKMTQKAIAEAAGVSVRTVRTVVADRKYEPLPPPLADKRQVALTPQPDSGGPASGDSAPADVAIVGGDSYGKCPACAGTKWDEDDDGVVCAKCNQPHGEPAGDVDEDRLATQRQKTRKTAEALMRAFDDLQCMRAKPEHAAAIIDCKRLVTIAKGWK